ncbi:MAG: hypothetical protein R3F61_11025 [Myxococcota bacterium]
MAKPGDPSRYAQKKVEPAHDQNQEQEEDGAQKEAPEPEHARQQNALGNEAIQNQMINTGNPGGDGGGGGGGLAMRKAGAEKDDHDYGGDDNAADDLPLTLEDLVRSWNPGTNKTQDRASWLEPMPDDELPPEDPEFLALARSGSTTVFEVSGGFTLDAQLQPSERVVAASLLDWTRAVQRWTPTTLLHRAIGHTYVPPRSFLQDAGGRILLSRARAAAIGSWMLLDSPVLQGVPPTPNVAFVAFCLELQGHRRHQEAVRIDPGVEGKQMPKAVDVFERAYTQPAGRVEPRELPGVARARIGALVEELVDLEDPAVYLPALIADPEPDTSEEDDPLGLDAILWDMTGAQRDPDAPLYYAAIQAAEKLAAATARTRIHLASTAVAIAQCSRLWSSGAPVETLLRACDQIDGETDRNLRLLVEIARAAQKRSVPPKGLKAGLKRSARALLTAQRASQAQLCDIIGGVLPAVSELPEPEAPVDDALEQAWLDGNPVHALPWLRRLPETPENTAALLLTRAAAGDRDPTLSDGLLTAADHLGSPYLAEVLRICVGPLLLSTGRLDEALASGRSQMALGARRRNGMVLANGTLLGVEALRLAGNADAAEALRVEGGQIAWRIGAPGALSLLARYSTANTARPGEVATYEDADEEEVS